MIRSQLRFSLLMTLAALCLVPAARADDKPIRALLVAGGCCHDYKHQKEILTEGISARANVAVDDRLRSRRRHQPPQPGLREGRLGQGLRRRRARRVLGRREGPEGHRPHPQAAPRGPAGRGPALRHALLSQRGLAAKGDALVRVHRPAFDRPRGPVADRRHLPRQGQPHHQALAGLDDDQRGALQQRAPASCWTRPSRWPAASRLHVAARNGRFVVVWTNIYNGKTRVFGTTLGHNNATCRRLAVSGPRDPRPALVRRQARRGPPEAGEEGAVGLKNFA